MEYRCEAESLDEFVIYLVNYVICRGYHWYVTGWIPAGKDPQSVDRKIIEKYELEISRATRWRRKKAGKANVRYLRLGQFFVLFCTRGEHSFWTEEEYRHLRHLPWRERQGSQIKSIRKHPLRFGGYSISFRPDGQQARGNSKIEYRVHVRIDDKPFKDLLAEFEHWSTRMTNESLITRLNRLPYLGYAPVRSQLAKLLRMINRRRRRHGLPAIGMDVINFHRPQPQQLLKSVNRDVK